MTSTYMASLSHHCPLLPNQISHVTWVHKYPLVTTFMIPLQSLSRKTDGNFRLIAGRDAKLGEGLRIPAHEVESHVVTAICRLLDDVQQLTNLICTHNEEPAVMGGIV